MINVAAPIIESEEIDAVNAVMHSGMLAQGPKVAELEESFAKYCGTRYALAVNSGTAAIHAALFAAGVGPGDEVITTPFSFIATINPILMLGARPVLVDIDPITFNLDYRKIEQAISDKTKAIVPVHLYGQPCDWDEISEIARKHGIKIIEDACQAVGANYKEKKTGSLGDLGCFSLYATKNIMCGEGGVITTNNDGYANAIKSFRQHGMVAPYEYAGLGYNYRMTDLHAAIAVEQLKKADKFNSSRQVTADYFTDNLQNLDGIVLPKTADNRTHVFHQYTIRVMSGARVNRDELMNELRAKGVGSGIYYPKPLHSYAHIQQLGYKIGDFPIAERLAGEVLSLPIHPKVTPEDAEKVVNAVKDILNGR